MLASTRTSKSKQLNLHTLPDAPPRAATGSGEWAPCAATGSGEWAPRATPTTSKSQQTSNNKHLETFLYGRKLQEPSCLTSSRCRTLLECHRVEVGSATLSVAFDSLNFRSSRPHPPTQGGPRQGEEEDLTGADVQLGRRWPEKPGRVNRISKVVGFMDDNGLRFSESNYYDSVENEEGKRYEDLRYEDLKEVDFESVEEVDTFYSFYSLAMGFSFRKEKLDKNIYGIVVRRQLVCSKEGTRKKKGPPKDNPVSHNLGSRTSFMKSVGIPEKGKQRNSHDMQAEEEGGNPNKRKCPHSHRETRLQEGIVLPA
ncbi:hypothetical protein ACLB2K_035823 [Fragaria x ananassa]